MQISKTMVAALAATAFTAIAALPALASPSNKVGTSYRATPPSSDPHDVFRRNIRIDDAGAKTVAAMKDCDCPMMRGSAPKSGHGG